MNDVSIKDKAVIFADEICKRYSDDECQELHQLIFEKVHYLMKKHQSQCSNLRAERETLILQVKELERSIQPPSRRSCLPGSEPERWEHRIGEREQGIKPEDIQ